MKPAITYLALLVTSSAATIATFHLGMENQGIATLTAGTLTLLSFQGRTQFHRPYWADGIAFPTPPTSHVLAVSIIVEAASIGIGLAGQHAAIGIISRCVGLLIQMAAIGKLSRDYNGGDPTDQILAGSQDATLNRQKKHHP